MLDNLKSLYELSQSNLVLGKELKINDGLIIIPVFKAKLNYFTFETTIKDNDGNALSGSMSYDPICFILIKNGVPSILPIAEKKETVMDKLPQLFESVDINSLIKGIKM